jgi:Hint module
VNDFEMTSPLVPWNGGVVFMRGNGIFDNIMVWSGRRQVRMPTAPTPTPPAEASGGPNYFFGNNIVETKASGSIRMSQLKIGDYIRAGNVDFTQVYGFGHVDHDVETNFVQLSMEHSLNDKEYVPLELTSNHLVFVERNNKVVAVPASDVVIAPRWQTSPRDSPDNSTWDLCTFDIFR